jgi:FMN reductase
MITTVLVGNPKAQSRTLEAATMLGAAIAGSVDNTIDIATFGAAVLDWSDPSVKEAIATAAASDLLIVASPTYKATYSGLLKVFLDRIDGKSGLAGVVTVPLMLGAGPAHFLAPELQLKPVLVELGALAPVQGLYLSERGYAEPDAFTPWLAQWKPVLERLLP